MSGPKPKITSETFTAEVVQAGNSLAIRITKQAGLLVLRRGDVVQVTLQRRS